MPDSQSDRFFTVESIDRALYTRWAWSGSNRFDVWPACRARL